MNARVAYVHDTDSLDDVASRLVSQKVTGCPVINDLGHVIGMISIHDIAGRTDTSVMTAGGVISGDIFGVTANATLYDAMLMMSDKEVSVLPVFEGTEIIGLVSSEMILRYSPEFTGTPG